MPNTESHTEIFRKLSAEDLLLMAALLLATWLLASMVRWMLHQLAESSRPRLRLRILRVIPIARLCVGLTGLVFIVRILIEPSFQNIIALTASVGLALAFAFKDYASSLAAGVVTVLENTYQPGDWVLIDGVYGEVKLIGVRAVHLVTADDDEVIIPHYRFWSKPVSNSTNGSRSLLCIADFYLHPDHDGQMVISCLEEVAAHSALRKPDSKLSVVVREKPWGSHYKIKAYVQESRDQFRFVTDLTVRGKAALRAKGLKFAHAVPYPESGGK